MILLDEVEAVFGELLIRDDVPWEGRLHFRLKDYEFIKENFPAVEGTVYYPACGRDFTPIFALKSSRFIYQDTGDFGFEPETHMNEEYAYLFKGLADKEIVRGLDIEVLRKRIAFRKKITFVTFSFEALDLESAENQYYKKTVELYSGKHEGDMEKYVPGGVEEAEMVYLNGMHLYPSVIPYLRRGAIIRSSTTINSCGYFHPVQNTEIESLGLEVIDLEKGIFRKL